MKRIKDTSSLSLGGVYNVMYVGDNAEYAKIEGKRTIRVTEIEPKLKFVTLFAKIGNPLRKDIQGPETTCGTEPFTEYEIFEPKNESEWFKKSIKFTSLQEALQQELVTEAEIQSCANWYSTCPFVAHMTGPERSLEGVVCEFDIPDGRGTKHPLLQSVYIVWKNWEEMKADFELLGLKPRT
jgi:hypothetical protein